MTRYPLNALACITVMAVLTIPLPALARWDDPPGNAAPDRHSTHEVRLSLIADPVLDPAFTMPQDLFILDQVLVGLFRIDQQTGTPVAELAKSWTMSEDATEFYVEVRDNATWTNGRPVTAFDIRNGILRTLSPGTLAPWSYPLYIIQNAYEFEQGLVEADTVGVVAPDATHLIFRLNAPASYLPSVLAVPGARPIPSDAPDWSDPNFMVTNGPYRVVEWFHGNSLVLEKNNRYYNHARVTIRDVGIKVLEEEVAWAAYRGGLLDAVVVPPAEWMPALADPALAPQLHVSPAPCTYYYGFNTALEPFDDPLVRKAFIAAANREGLIADVLGYAQQPALTFTPPSMFGYVDGYSEGIGIPYDPDHARMWLAEAGYAGGEGLPPISLVFNDLPGHHAIAEYLRQNWLDNLNVAVSLEYLPWEEYLARVDNDPPQMWRLGWCMDHRDGYNFLQDAVVSRLGSWGELSDTAYFSLLDEAAREQNAPERAALYRQAEEILVEQEAVMLPIYFYSTGVANRSCLQMSYGSDWPGGLGGWIADWRFKQCGK